MKLEALKEFLPNNNISLILVLFLITASSCQTPSLKHHKKSLTKWSDFWNTLCLTGEGVGQFTDDNDQSSFDFESLFIPGKKWIIAAYHPLKGEETFELDLNKNKFQKPMLSSLLSFGRVISQIKYNTTSKIKCSESSDFNSCFDELNGYTFTFWHNSTPLKITVSIKKSDFVGHILTKSTKLGPFPAFELISESSKEKISFHFIKCHLNK